MTDVINFRSKRKEHDRDKKRQHAEENRAMHGRTKGERKRDDLQRDRAERHLAGHKLTPEAEKDDP